MKKKSLFILITPILAAAMLTSCSSEIPEQPPAPPEVTDTSVPSSGQFTIAGMMTNTEPGYFKTAFQDTVDVEINVEICENGYPGEYEKYVQRLGTALMAGTAPDVFYLPSELYFDYGISPYTYDINQFFETDPDAGKDDYYENILAAFEINGKLPVWPNSVYFIPFVGLHRDLNSVINPLYFEEDTITYREMLQYYYELPAEIQAAYPLFSGHNAYSTLLLGGAFDFRTKQAHFDNENYIQLLGLANGAADPNNPDKLRYLSYSLYARDVPDYKYVFNTPIMAYKDLFLPPKDDYWYEFDNGVNPPFLEGPSGLFTDIKPLTTENGELYIQYDGNFAVNANSEHLDLAWEFLKFAASEEVSPYILRTHNIMLNRELNQEYMYSDLEYFVKAALIGTARPPLDEMDAVILTEEHQTDIQKTAEKMLAWCEMPMVLGLGDIPETSPIMEDYIGGKITAQQAAQQLQSKVSLILME